MLCTSDVSFIITWRKVRSGLEGKEGYTVNGQFALLVCGLLHFFLYTLMSFMLLGLQYF